MTDFAAIIGRRMLDEIQGEPVVDIYTPTGLGVYLLAAKVPELCPTCGGKGYERDWFDAPVDCPDCPTIGKLLAIGAAVMTAEVSGGWIVQLPGQLATNTADLLLTQLRAVTP